MAYFAYITKIKNIYKHPNADKLQIGQCLSNNVIVSMDFHEDQMGIYFPVDGKIGQEFALENQLLRLKDENGKVTVGYLDPKKRNIRALNLRGEKSDGLFLSLQSLSAFCDISLLKDGDKIDMIGGIVICEKYIPARKNSKNSSGASKACMKKTHKEFPFFFKHIDTDQLAFNENKFCRGDLCTISLKMHGTSARTSCTVVKSTKYVPYWKRFFGVKSTPTKSWGFVTGSRNVVMDFEAVDASKISNNKEFRYEWHKKITPLLQEGETVYYEVIGWEDNQKMIMPSCNNSKINDKEFSKKYGNATKFTYGCNTGENNAYIYRMTKTDEHGNIIEYPSWLIKIRCSEMGLNFIHVFDQFIFTTWDDLMSRVGQYCDGPDPIGKTHVREGVVVRIENSREFKAFKYKNFAFKCLEGIIKDEASEPDMEELESLAQEDK